MRKILLGLALLIASLFIPAEVPLIGGFGINVVEAAGKKTVQVRTYARKSGTVVQTHRRSPPSHR